MPHTENKSSKRSLLNNLAVALGKMADKTELKVTVLDPEKVTTREIILHCANKGIDSNDIVNLKRSEYWTDLIDFYEVYKNTNMDAFFKLIDEMIQKLKANK